MDIIQITTDGENLIALTKSGALYIRKINNVDTMWEEIEVPVKEGKGKNFRPLEDKIQKII